MRDEQRKRRGRRAHLNDFHLNLAGEYVYDGALFACRAEADAARASQRRLWAAAAALAIAAIAGGCIPAPGMQNHFYVILPYLGEVLCAASVVWALAKIGTDWSAVREYVYERTVPVLPIRAACTAAFALLGAAAEAVHLALSSSGGQTIFAALYFLLKLLAALCALFIRREILRTNWGKVPKKPDR